MVPVADPAAGWYPDPGGSAKLRYWNGSAWTQHVSPPEPEPEPEPAPPAPEVAPEGQPPVPQLGEGSAAGAQPPAVALSTIPPPIGTPLWQAPEADGPGQRLGPDGQVLSGWWRRLAGYLIDAVILWVVAAFAVGIVGAVTGGFGELVDAQTWSELVAKAEANPAYQPSEAELQALIGPGLAPFLTWITFVTLVLGFGNGVVLVAASGQTIGDRVVGTRKVTAGRQVPGFGAAFLRWLIPVTLGVLQVLPAIGFLALTAWILDYLWPLWDPRRQALHDKAARTYVERSSLAGPVNR